LDISKLELELKGLEESIQKADLRMEEAKIRRNTEKKRLLQEIELLESENAMKQDMLKMKE
jgi:hypothetical protein